LISRYVLASAVGGDANHLLRGGVDVVVGRSCRRGDEPPIDEHPLFALDV
jgi:hypothetical protein